MSYATFGDLLKYLRRRARLTQRELSIAVGYSEALTSDSALIVELGLSLALALEFFWFVRGHDQLRRRYIGELVNAPQQPGHTAAYARALGLVASWSDDPEQAQTLFQTALTLSYQLEDEAALGSVYFAYGIAGWFWAPPAEARAHFEQSLSFFRELNDRVNLKRVLAELGEYSQVKANDRPTAQRSYLESLQLARQLGDGRGQAIALTHLADMAIEQAEIESARAYANEGIVIARRINDLESLAWGLNALGSAALGEGQWAEAEQLLTESLEMSREWGATWHVVIRRDWLTRVWLYQNDLDRAADSFAENRLAAEQADFEGGLASSLHGLGDVALARGDLVQARILLTQAFRPMHTGNFLYTLAYVLDSFSTLTLQEGQPIKAAQLLGAANVLRESIHTRLLPIEQTRRELLANKVRLQLNDSDFAAAEQIGRALTLDQAMVST
jgi:tetratricopeptide (TPR) repeat protein